MHRISRACHDLRFECYACLLMFSQCCTDANRGCGVGHLYFAMDCKHVGAGVGHDDLEEQIPVMLTTAELEDACLKGQFKVSSVSYEINEDWLIHPYGVCLIGPLLGDYNGACINAFQKTDRCCSPNANISVVMTCSCSLIYRLNEVLELY